jgi:leader peptidase (prepilin peptidase) / N-methyltransferase
MTVAWVSVGAVLLFAAFTAIACERARAYGRPLALASISTPVTIATTVVVCAWWSSHGESAFSRLVLLVSSSVCALSDIQTGYVFDRVLIAAMVLMIPAAVVSGSAAQAVSGAALAGFLVMAPRALSCGRAMGFGDVKLAATIGFSLGPGDALRALWWASVCGGAFALVLIVARRARRGASLRFAPFLAFGAWCAAMGWR